MAWWKTAEVGDKVVCVLNPSPIRPASGSVPDIKKGDILTISFIGEDAVFLHGFYFEFVESGQQYGVSGFRPIQPKSTDKGMSILKSILNGKRVPEVA